MSEKYYLLKSCHTIKSLIKHKFEIAYEKKSPDKIKRQSFPALSVNPVDLTGAGDALIAAVATSLCSGNDFMSSSAIGSCMAALAVENMGNKNIDQLSLRNYLTNLLSNNQ